MIRNYITKIIICFVFAILLVGMFSGCSNEDIEKNEEDSDLQNKDSFSNISAEEAKKRLDSENGIILLDVRTKKEYESGHIKNSVLIPVDNLKEDALENLRDKEVPIFVYCRSGNRSVTAANILVNLGYKNVYNLGGINDWPYEVVK